jgi:hypothetical protein
MIDREIDLDLEGAFDSSVFVEDAILEARAVFRKHRATCSNEVLAAIVYEAFRDACGECEGAFEAFEREFPTLVLEGV